MVAWCDGGVLHRRGADEADLCIVVHCLLCGRFRDGRQSFALVFSFYHGRFALVNR